MDIRYDQLDGALVARMGDQRLDAAVAIQFKDVMRAVLQNARGRVILDLSRVDFLDSSGLGALVAVMKLAGPERGLELAGLTPAVRKVFRLTRMDQVFTIHDVVPPDLAPGMPEGQARVPDGAQHVG